MTHSKKSTTKKSAPKKTRNYYLTTIKGFTFDRSKPFTTLPPIDIFFQGHEFVKLLNRSQCKALVAKYPQFASKLKIDGDKRLTATWRQAVIQLAQWVRQGFIYDDDFELTKGNLAGRVDYAKKLKNGKIRIQVGHWGFSLVRDLTEEEAKALVHPWAAYLYFKK